MLIRVRGMRNTTGSSLGCFFFLSFVLFHGENMITATYLENLYCFIFSITLRNTIFILTFFYLLVFSFLKLILFNFIFIFFYFAEEDIDELNVHVVRYRPEELSKLTKMTKFNKKEIQLIYRGFKQVSFGPKYSFLGFYCKT